MSLSRILNDDPVPPPSVRQGYLPAHRLMNVEMDPFKRTPSSTPGLSSRLTPSQLIPHPLGITPRTYDHHWGNNHIPRDRQGHRCMSPEEPQEFVHQHSSEDREFHLSWNCPFMPLHHQHTPRKTSHRLKQPRLTSPPNDPVEPDPQEALAEEERRLISSDLDDCEEIWIGELSEYMLETQKRLKHVERWFEASVLERNSTAAQSMSHHYARRIASIPRPPLPPPLAPPIMRDDLHSRYSPSAMEFSHMYETGLSRSRRDVLGHSSAADAAHEFERSILDDVQDLPGPGVMTKSRAKRDTAKRPASQAVSDGSSDFDIPNKNDRSLPRNKKRRLDNIAVSAADDLERSVGGDHVLESTAIKLAITTKLKGKGKLAQPELIMKVFLHHLNQSAKKVQSKRSSPELASHPPSISGDVTPALSRPSSPAPTNSTLVYELDELVPPLKKAKKVDDVAMAKRVKSLEEAQRKVWMTIAKRDVAKVFKYHATGYAARQSQSKRIAEMAVMQARKPFTKTAKANKDTQAKAKRLTREMQGFWRKNEREERDVRKREQKEANERLKIEEEKREEARQARKLEFLISQTELYSHFVGNKLKTTEIEGGSEQLPTPAGAEVEDVHPNQLQDINFDDEDQTNLHRHARHNAQEALALAKQRVQQFDTQAALERKTNEAVKLAMAQAHIHEESDEVPDAPTGLVDLDSDELNFQNPTSLSGPLTIGQPKMLMAQLKEYQLKGLNWLATLYEQGINGILADEMGLGKTVQSISLLAYLAETHDIWGPFLVVAPASTLHNWQQELTRFVPGLKALPYWGNVKDRATLRKFWSKKEISYNQDAPFHVLITSYQLVTQDQQYFQRVKWQYMILDEAQNIKNSSSVRWKTLLGFHCRNRLLLTGTPIQNSMQELWALLHFIMPSLFDSHDEFNEWFSKDIENAAENKGSKLNEHQLRRLHMILKPFMLRRLKHNVQNELSEKIEKDIYVDLSARQRALYKALLANVSVADLLAKAANIGDVDSARSLMNLVMQFRKVCNHPELFERADVVAPVSFTQFGRSGPLSREGDYIHLGYSTRNPIEFAIPQLLYHSGGLLEIPSEDSRSTSQLNCLTKMFNIWSVDWIQQSLSETVSSSFAFLRILDKSPQEAHNLHRAPLMRRSLLAVNEQAQILHDAPFFTDPFFAAHTATSALRLLAIKALHYLEIPEGLPRAHSISMATWTQSCLSRPELKWFVPPVVAPPVAMYCVDRTFMESQSHLGDAPLETLAMYGLPPRLWDSEDAWASYQACIPGVPASGLIGSSPSYQIPSSSMQVPEAKRLIYDSAKLARLDALLQELKAGDHRVLVYFQMTRMMDLMEEYLIYRQYKYLRLDGSSKLEDRRDMVIDWQTRPDIFVFLLSTRAGGLGINLTAADTVVFYDHDWNPSNDAQAMDRAHRLGQTRQVTVYRLITRGTIDERIVQLARVKKDVQDIVVGNKNFTDVTKPSEIVQLLLNDEQLATLESSTNQNVEGNTVNSDAAQPVRDLWNDEGDDFFGHSGPTLPNVATDGVEEETGASAAAAARGRKRKAVDRAHGEGSQPVKGKQGEWETLNRILLARYIYTRYTYLYTTII
ncbi:SNF2 family N-terminal domain-containing protein [Infundibulicybe gibba]|nr:SNF2 family N-terminal domain-containing protein [Infundibulicybe gibba]